MATKNDKKEALKRLREKMPPGTTVWTKLLHVSKSGMTRWLDVYIIVNNEPLRYTWSVADAVDMSYSVKHEGVKVDGCGMDIGFHLVNCLSYALHGYETKGKRAKAAERDGLPFTATNKRAFRAGYSLNHRWL